MSHAMNRRDWFRKTGAAAAAGLVLGSGAAAGPLALAEPRRSRPAGEPARLGLNENPYGPSPRAREAVQAALDEACRYPHQAARELVGLLARKEGVPEDHVLLGAGSTEILDLAGMTYGAAGGEVVTAHPSFLGLTHYAETMGGHVHYVPLNEALEHDLDAMERRVTGATRLVYLCNPNNPTGTLVSGAALRAFCEAASSRAIVFVDEAYLDLVEDPSERQSMVGLVREGRNVIVARTFSKVHGLAGLRVGYGIARPDLLERMQRYRMAGPGILGIAAATASVQDEAFQAFSRTKILEARRFTCGLLDRLGYRYAAPHGNFVFFETGRPHAEFSAAMRERGVAVARAFPPFTTWCRVSMGTGDDMDRFASALTALAAR